MVQEDDFLMISGIQHFFYCKRQWALIHIENQWESNIYTVKGDIAHERVDDPFFTETRNDKIISRSVPLISFQNGFYGISDVVEYTKSDTGIKLAGRDGLFKIEPVEYKVGKPKSDNCDVIQLCLQALCLEEMFKTKVDKGFLYYVKTRRRVEIEFDEPLRKLTYDTCQEMHEIINQNFTPKAKYEKKCDHCSLYRLCLPKVISKTKKVSQYIKEEIKKGGLME